MSVLDCLRAGHLRDKSAFRMPPLSESDQLVLDGLVGHEEDGVAMTVCAACMGRAETAVRTCTPEMRRRCQRDEDKTSQRLCNMCAEDRLGSTLQRDKGCSLYRGTCMGSVEKRIRGIVPPNLDIVGAHDKGGLRYCKKPSTFNSEQHYFTEADIMQARCPATHPCRSRARLPAVHAGSLLQACPSQVGQSCTEDKPIWTNWDWAKDHTDPRTVLDRLGLRCEDPDDERTCPRSRRCAESVAHLCHEDQPDWTKIDVINQRWGEVVGEEQNLPPYLDPEQEGGHAWDFLRSAVPGSHDDYQFDVQVDWGIRPTFDPNAGGPTPAPTTPAPTDDSDDDDPGIN